MSETLTPCLLTPSPEEDIRASTSGRSHKSSQIPKVYSHCTAKASSEAEQTGLTTGQLRNRIYLKDNGRPIKNFKQECFESALKVADIIDRQVEPELVAQAHNSSTRKVEAGGFLRVLGQSGPCSKSHPSQDFIVRHDCLKI